MPPRPGALTRSTVGTDAVDPKLRAPDDALHWIWSWRVQVQRLADSTAADGAGESRLEQRRSFSRTSFDEHMLVVVGGNLAKALAAAQHYHPSVVVEQSTTDALRVLRNLYEHWDEQRVAFESPNTDKTRSAAEFAAKFPERRPWSIVYDTTDSYLAGVVGIAQFTSALVAIEDELLRAGAGTRKVTGCLTSA